MIADLRIFGFYGRHVEGVRSRPLVGARPFSLRFLPLDTVSLFPPQFSPLLRCPTISRYFSSQDRRSMIHRKMFVARGDLQRGRSRAELLLRTNGTNGAYQRNCVKYTRANVYGPMRISMSRKLTNYHRCLLSRKRCSARKRKLASSFEAFV